MTRTPSGVVSLSALSEDDFCEERRYLVHVHACMIGHPNGTCRVVLCPAGETLERVGREIDLMSLLISEQQGFGYHPERAA